MPDLQRGYQLTGFSPILLLFFPGDLVQQGLHLLGMLFFFGENALHQSPAGRIIVGEVTDDFRVGFDGDPFGYQILPPESCRSSSRPLRIPSGCV